MPEYAPGVPMWVDVSSSDMDKTRAFYSGLFGWNADVVPDPQAGGYTMFMLDGKMVAGGGPTFSPEQRPAWATYVCSEDADATIQKVKDAGGQVVMGPMDVMGQGRMAVFVDPTGAHFSIWQPQIHKGAELVNKPGSFCWNELYSRDMPAAKEFYKEVFGWEIDDTEFEGGAYTLFKVNDQPIAGGMDMSFLPADVPPHWLVYFAVEDTAGSVVKAKDFGGQILQDTKDTPMGPIAVIDDPVRVVFAIIQLQSGRE